MTPIERLFEREGLPLFGLPSALATMYGGDFGIARPGLYANFVASVDGVVALSEPAGDSGAVISGGSEPDRFVMGLLRACADAVLVGAATFRKASGERWSAENIYPAAAGLFTDLRRQLGLGPVPRLVVVTGSGNLDLAQPALRDALIVTTARGEARLGRSLPAGAHVVVFDAERIRGRALVELFRAESLPIVLTEGGPSLVGQLVQQGVVDELFLTTSPRVFGRSANDGRKSLLDGVDLTNQWLDLMSLRRHGSHLFARYGLRSGGAPT